MNYNNNTKYSKFDIQLFLNETLYIITLSAQLFKLLLEFQFKKVTFNLT